MRPSRTRGTISLRAALIGQSATSTVPHRLPRFYFLHRDCLCKRRDANAYDRLRPYNLCGSGQDFAGSSEWENAQRGPLSTSGTHAVAFCGTLAGSIARHGTGNKVQAPGTASSLPPRTFAGAMPRLLALEQLNPNAVRVLHERLAPPDGAAYFAGTDDDLDAFVGQFGDGSIEVVHVEPEVVEFLAVNVGRSKPTSLDIPVEFEELLPAGAAQCDDLALRGRRPLARLNALHPQDLGVESEGFVHVLDPDSRVVQAVEVHRGGNRLSPR